MKKDCLMGSEGKGMTQQEAIRLIDPETCISALAERFAENEDEYDIYRILEEAFRVAREALKKQIPVPVDQATIDLGTGEPAYDMAECPRCGWETDDADARWGDLFCPNCGQALLWEDSDES